MKKNDHIVKNKLFRRISRSLLIIVCLLVLLIMGAGMYIYNRLKASLPILDGEFRVSGLSDVVKVERDALGIPTILGGNRYDIAIALGFLHAQDRFFQMDVFRRTSAGQLAELFGADLVKIDQMLRIHRFRALARQVLEQASENDHMLLECYAKGVNLGLNKLGKPPFEYMVLRTEPEPWLPEDSVLVIFSMYWENEDENRTFEEAVTLLYEKLPKPVADFLVPFGTPWDAPLQGEPFAMPPLPGSEVYDLRQLPREASFPKELPKIENLVGLRKMSGSNCWALKGSLTGKKGALLANDMHLNITVPNTWYRASWERPAEDGSGERITVTGVTLPGTPPMIVGSNTRVAWGFTLSKIDTCDLVILEPAPKNPDAYLTPDGPQQFQRYRETIRVKGEEAISQEVLWTRWGPVLDTDHQGRRRALRWVAHDPKGINLNITKLEVAETVDQAISVANTCGGPSQNFVVADSSGSLGWSLYGKIPRRFGHAGLVAASWADGSRGWNGYYDPEEYPRIVNPSSGRIWSANSRVLQADILRMLGNGRLDLGARARQIRDALHKLEEANEEDMLRIQLDDRAHFLEPWRDLLLEVLIPETIANNPKRAKFRNLVETTWTGRASVDSSAFLLVRSYRVFMLQEVYGGLTQPCRNADDRFNHFKLSQFEGPLWTLVTQRPIHLLNPKYASWQELFLAVVDTTIDYQLNGKSLIDQTWGDRNTARIQHPFSTAVPLLGRWLDMPPTPLPGSNYTPRFQSGSAGASQRMVVSPGSEKDGIFHMPCGQSGHPLSPFFRAGHENWVQGLATPFLPGTAEHLLILVPSSSL